MVRQYTSCILCNPGHSINDKPARPKCLWYTSATSPDRSAIPHFSSSYCQIKRNMGMPACGRSASFPSKIAIRAVEMKITQFPHIYCDFQNFVYFRPIRDSRIQHLQKNIPVTLSHIMATNTALRGRQHAESAESNCVHKQTEEKRINNHNSPPRQCKNTLPPAGFGTFLLVAPHTAMLW